MSNPTPSASATVTIVPSAGTLYYLSPASAGGSDSNNGLSPNSPWLTPNHPVNCGDVIMASPGTSYASASFSSGKWGTVTCKAGNNVAWLKCATFDACKISSGNSGVGGIWVAPKLLGHSRLGGHYNRRPICWVLCGEAELHKSGRNSPYHFRQQRSERMPRRWL